MRVSALACLAFALPALCQAQAPRALKLPPATAQLAEEFTRIASVRELRDGRVLISDPREVRIVLADLGTGTVQQVGRKGAGPNEYTMAGSLVPLAGDSSLVADVQQGRWLLFAGATIVATLPPDTPIIKAIRGFLRGADGLGHVWTTRSPKEFNQEKPQPGTLRFGAADSDYVVRGHRGTAKLDTVTKVRVAASQRTVTTNAQGKFSSISVANLPLQPGEEFAVFQDGWFAVARLDPYRVDWISPAGTVTRGKPLPVTRIRMTASEKEAYLARQAAARARSGGNQQLPEALRKQLEAVRNQLPEFFPPFMSNGALAAGDGTLWLLQPVSLNFPDPRYDVVDRRGTLVGVVSLAQGERVVTVSKTSVYVAWRDEDDIERLRRHPLPYAGP